MYDSLYPFCRRNVSLDRTHHESEAAFQNIFVIPMDTKAEQTDHPDIHQTEEQGGLVTEHSVNITSN